MMSTNIYTTPNGDRFEILPESRFMEGTHWLYPEYPALKALQGTHLNRQQNWDLFKIQYESR